MKILYSFTVPQKVTVPESSEAVNEKGEKVVVTKNVEKLVPVKFLIRKPTRAMFDDADLFYGVQLSQCIKEGLLTRAQLATKFADEGATLSEAERKRYTETFVRLHEKNKEYQELTLAKEEDRTPEQKEAIENLMKEMTELNRELQQLEMEQNSLFDYTAENRARNKTILWWVFQLGFKEDNKPIFDGATFKDKLAQYDKFEEDDNEFMLTAIKSLLYYISFWYMGKAEKQEDFDRLAEMAGISNKEPSKDAEKEPVKE